MKLIYNEMGQFAEKTFPDATPIEHLKKLQQEVNESIQAPTDITEYADCLLALFGAAYRAGFTYAELVVATANKLIVCQNRKWERKPDGTYQHIK
jgi:hypothetical protein